MKLSVVLATKNEEQNIVKCIKSVQQVADEIIIVDEESTDKTKELAESLGVRVYTTKHNPIFHKTKQIAIDKAKGEWILQLDADEVVTPELGKEINTVINSTNTDLLVMTPKNTLFKKHQLIIEKRDGKLGNNTGEVVAFFIPRLNLFLNKPLRYAGVYPDAVIRLIKNGKAYLPAKSVHEQMVINGEVRWLTNDLEHHDSPTLGRYISRMNRYTDLRAAEFKASSLPKSVIYLFIYTTVKPVLIFLKLFVRHKGFLDGIRGFLWSFLSALHFPLAYYKYYTSDSFPS